MLCLKRKQKYFGYPNTGGNLHQGDIAKVKSKAEELISWWFSYKEEGCLTTLHENEGAKSFEFEKELWVQLRMEHPLDHNA